MNEHSFILLQAASARVKGKSVGTRAVSDVTRCYGRLIEHRTGARLLAARFARGRGGEYAAAEGARAFNRLKTI
jgi:hypothetical protein